MPSMGIDHLSDDQQYAFNLFKQRKNLFVTGPGGSGKTKLIETIKEHSVNNRIKCVVCALTGCAAHLLPKECTAKTIHSWSGIGQCKGEAEDIIKHVLKWKKTEWKMVDVLVIDEVSMMSLKVFNVLDAIGRMTRGMPEVPFGNIQVVFLGDFYQLPPVANKGENDTGKFCFESPVWTEIFPPSNVVQLTTVFRQKDPVYRNILLEIREGALSDESRDILHKHFLRTRMISAPIRPGLVSEHFTKLFPLRGQADDYNHLMFSKIEQPVYEFECIEKDDLKTYMYTNNPINEKMIIKCASLSNAAKRYTIDGMKKDANYSDVLYLKKGAFVMSLVNAHDLGIYNGSQGIVIDFVGKGSNVEPVVEFFNGVTKSIPRVLVQSFDYQCLGVSQIPLCLAWARTIHKSQGATLDFAEIDVGFGIFEYGQTYVALSRVRSLEDLRLSGFNPQRIKTNPKVKQYYTSINADASLATASVPDAATASADASTTEDDDDNNDDESL